MKKLYKHQKWWNDRNSRRKALLKRRKHNKKDNITNSQAHSVNKWDIFESPKKLDLTLHTDETFTYFNKIRNANSYQGILIDLIPLEDISPECVMILAAEMERHILISKKRFRLKDYNKWHKNVRQQLTEVGLFKVLHIKKAKNITRNKNISWIKLTSNNNFNNTMISNLMEDIIDLVKEEFPFDDIIQQRLYGALFEPTTNTLEHAYPQGFTRESCIQNRWWVGASYNRLNNRLNLMVYDMGITIPKAVKNKYEIKENTVVAVKKRKIDLSSFLNKPDGDIIKLAIDNGGNIKRGKSSTKLRNRGHGLSKMRQFIKNNFKGGTFRVTSGHGRCTCLMGSYCPDNSTEEICVENLPQILNGTLIEWEIEL